MHCEILLNNSSRKVDAQVLGGDNENILTSMPQVNGQFIFFAPDEKIQISCYYEDSVYLFDTEFKGIVTIKDLALYEFQIINLTISDNKRLEERKNTSLPAIITNNDEMIFATILDISETGMRIETKVPIINKKINIRFEHYDKIYSAKGIIVRKQEDKNSFIYGLKVEFD